MSDHCCVTIDGAVFTIIISIYLDNFLQVEEQRIYCLALGEIVELEEWIHGEGNIFSTTNVNHISNIFVINAAFPLQGAERIGSQRGGREGAV